MKKYQEIINNELEKYIINDSCPEKILNESKRYSMMAGGKRLRPILMLCTYTLFKEDYEKILPYAVALEMIHNFSLIHDDLPGIDNDDFRHGKPANHKKYNESTAILAGDSLLNNAYKVISEDLKSSTQQDLNNKLKIFNEFTIATDRMIAGEYVDTESEGKQISNELLEYIHVNKTAELLKLSIKAGAIMANASQKELDILCQYSEKIGLAFQIKDDILSEEGDEKVLGKPVGNDRADKKCTYVTKYGLEESKIILKQTIQQAIEKIEIFGEKGEFLKQLAIYIECRNK